MTDTRISLVETSGLERLAAAAAHGSLLLGVPFLLPLANMVVFTLWKPSAYVKEQSLQALVFHAVTTLVFVGLLVGAALLGFFGVVQSVLATGGELDLVLPPHWGWAFGLVFAACFFMLWASIVGLIATIKAFQGRAYRYPLIGRLLSSAD